MVVGERRSQQILADDRRSLNPDLCAAHIFLVLASCYLYVYRQESFHIVAQFDKRVDDLACGLYAIGVRKGDNVGIWSTNVPDWLTYMFACARLGAVAVTVNTSYKSHELEYLVKQADLLTVVNRSKQRIVIPSSLYFAMISLRRA